MITTPPAPTRERILDAAVDLFGRRGYRATSVGEIERAAGLIPRRGGLYKHFPSKEALLEAVVERRGRVVDELESLASTAPLAPDAREEVGVLIRIAFREIGRDQEVLRIVMREGDNFPELRDRFHDRIVRRGHEQAAERLRLLAERGGRGRARRGRPRRGRARADHQLPGPDDLVRAPARATSTRHRYLDTWTASAVSLLEAHGLVPGGHDEGGIQVSNGDHLTADRGAIRFLLLALGVPQALIGLWALLGPHSFYADFPAGTDGWVHVLGPFDEHLVTDVGALFVALGRGDGLRGDEPAPRDASWRRPRAGWSSRCRTSSGTCSTSTRTRPRTRSRTP